MKEAFSPLLVSAALKSVDESLVSGPVVDPFCGSGTALLAAAQAGRTAAGTEVNPFLAFVARSKFLSPNVQHLKHASEITLSAMHDPQPSPFEGYSTFSAGGGRKKWLFNQGVLRSFEAGATVLRTFKPAVRDLISLALLAAAMDCCNAKRDGKCLRYHSDWQDRRYSGASLRASFEQRISSIANDVRTTPVQRNAATIYNADARRVFPLKGERKFSLCVTSPPYLNSFDYSDVYRPELFLGRWVRNTADLRKIRLRTVRSHVQVEWPAPIKSNYGPLLESSIGALNKVKASLWDRRLVHMVQAYFEDLDGILRRLLQHALPRAEAWIVVSTSAYAGVEIPVDLIIADIATRAGWDLVEIGVLRQLRSAGQHWSKSHSAGPPLRESAVILRSPE